MWISLLAALAPLVSAPDDAALFSWDVEPLMDGESAAVACADGSIRIFHLATGRTRATLAGHTDEVVDVAVSPRGDLLATAAHDATVRLWSLAGGSSRKLAVTQLHLYWGDTLLFSPDGSMLVGVAHDGSLAVVWSSATAEEQLRLPVERKITAAAWFPDGRLATAGGDGCVRVWDVETGEEVGGVQRLPEPLSTIACHPGGVRVAVGCGITVVLVDTALGAELARARHGEEVFGSQQVQQLLFTPGGDGLLVTSGGFWNVFLDDANTLERRWRVDLNGGTSAPMRVTLERASERVGLSCAPRIVGLEDGLDVCQLAQELGEIRFAPGGQFVVTQDAEGTVVLRAEDLKRLYKRIEHADGAYTVLR